MTYLPPSPRRLQGAVPYGNSKRGKAWTGTCSKREGQGDPRISALDSCVLELVARGYRVCLSTHSPQVLDALWALKHLRETRARPEILLNIFEAPNTPPMQRLATSAMEKRVKVYYFNREDVTTSDISELDPSAEGQAEAGWGGLSEFSGRANEAVARAVANADREAQP